MDESLEVVEKLASALDADDLEAVRRLLSGDCEYSISGAKHVGPDAIVASYAEGSALARRLFDVVDFDHEIIEQVRDRAHLVDFVDRLTYADAELVHHSRQVVEVGEDRLVSRIDDVTEQSAKYQVDAFLARHGLER